MSFIGVVSDKNNESEIINILNKKFKQSNRKCEIIGINEKSIDNIKNIKFETILIDKDPVLQEEALFYKILQNSKYILVNVDLITTLHFIKDLESILITYGFNSKATITASSVEGEEILLCIQRNIKTMEGMMIEQQEYKVENNSSNLYINMAIGIISLLYHLKPMD